MQSNLSPQRQRQLISTQNLIIGAQQHINRLDQSIASVQAQKSNFIATFNQRVAAFDNNIENLINIKTRRLNDLSRLNDILNSIQTGGNNQPSPDAGNSNTSNPKFGETVLGAHRSLMSVWSAREGTTDFVVPFVPRNFNFRVTRPSIFNTHKGSTSWQQCMLKDLGYDNNGNIQWLELYGYFADGSNNILSNQTSVQEILSNAKYVPMSITLQSPAIGVANPVIKVDGNLNNLDGKILGTGKSQISWLVSKLTAWARSTAFLVPLKVCGNHYDSTYGDNIVSTIDCEGCLGGQVYSGSRRNLTSVSQVNSVSNRDSSIVLPNTLQREYYDRLYDFMNIRKTAVSTTIGTLINYDNIIVGPG